MKAKTTTENGFKETEIGLIPSDWDVVELTENSVARLIMGQSPPSSTYNKDKKGLPFLQGKAEFGSVSPSPEKWCTKPSRIAKKNDVLISVRAPVGDVNISPFQCSIGRGLAAIRADKKSLPYFLFYYLQYSKKRIEDKGTGSTFKAINKSVLEHFKIILPEITEQQKIASVLSKIQQAIEQQDKIIQITKELKKSLMNKLFSEGLYGEEQKETEVGMIPKSWSITPAEKYCERVTDGTHESPKPAESGYHLVTSKNLKDGKIIFDGCYLISEENYKSVNERSKVDLYDVVFGMIGTIGSPVIIRKEPDFSIKNVGLFKTGKDKDLGLWLYYYLSSDSVERLVDKQKAGATQKYIPLWFLRQLPVPVLSEKERNEIIKVLEDISLKLDAEENRLVILRNLFRTMLNQLMTGKVRVKNLDIEVN